MTNIGVIATDPQMYEAIPGIAAELGLANCVTLRQGTVDEGLAIGRAMERDGADVIVSRGGTVELLHSAGIRAPIVAVQFSIEDISAMLHKAKSITGRDNPTIAFISFTRAVKSLKAFSALLNIDLHVYHVETTYGGIKEGVTRAMTEHADVIVGGVTTQAAMATSDIPFILHESGADSLRQALREAKLIAYARSLEQTQTQMFKAVVESSVDGIFLLSPEGIIQVANPAGVRMLRLAIAPEGRNIRDVFPLGGFAQCVATGQAVHGDIVRFGGREFVVTISPMLNQRQVTGVVVSFQSAVHIAEIESRIRHSRSAKGMNTQYDFSDIEGTSPQLCAIIEQAGRYASEDDTILLQGETGTGKELFAQAIHNASPKRQGPFVAVNCSSLPMSILESELFGYEEGAFTGASRKGRAGLFEQADQGTIFLDEVSGLDDHSQGRLLRVLQERRILRLGGNTYLPVAFRVIAASNVDLWSLVRQGKFRQDLFFRLHVLPLTLPPLRAREGDVEYLAGIFLQRHATTARRVSWTPEALRALKEHDWPGNVRELEHCVRRIYLNCRGADVTVPDVRKALEATLSYPAPAEDGALPAVPPQPGMTDAVLAAEKKAVIEALRTAKYNQRKAAEILKMDTSTLYRKMKKFHIEKYTI